MTTSVSVSPRSMLFVPADRPDRFAKAAGCGADAIILDLEDAVAPANKAAARKHAAVWLASRNAFLRINAPGTPWFDDDIALVVQHPCAVMIPKVQTAAQTADIVDRLPDVPVVVLLETVMGVVNSVAICAVDGVAAAAFGSVDLGAEIGVDPSDRQALAHARSTIVMAAAAAQLAPPLDGVCVDFAAPGAAGDEARYAASLGFGGKMCIHPRQVEAVNNAFTPDREDIIWAQTVVETSGGAELAVLDGKMVDKPVILRAQRILSRAAAIKGMSR